MRKEIEVKARVGDLEVLKKAFEKKGVVFSEPLAQNDETFVDRNYGDYATFQPGKNLLRIRVQNGKFIFTLKQPQHVNELDAVEHETEIVDPKQLKEIILMLGYQPIVQIHKTRMRGKFGDFEICLDQVKELGTFVELEKIT